MRCWVVINHRNLPTCHIPKGLGTLNATVARTSRRASVSLGDYGCAGGLECRYRFYRRTSTPPAFTSLERFVQWMIAAHYTIIILHPSGRRSSGEGLGGCKISQKQTTSAHTFRDGDVSQQDIRLLL